MIAVDASSLIAYLVGMTGPDVDRVDASFRSGELVLPPVVVTQVLSDPHTSEKLRPTIMNISVLPILDGYWARTGLIRSTLKRHKITARTEYALAAQSCIDHDVALITRDQDFRHFVKHCGLRLA